MEQGLEVDELGGLVRVDFLEKVEHVGLHVAHEVVIDPDFVKPFEQVVAVALIGDLHVEFDVALVVG